MQINSPITKLKDRVGPIVNRTHMHYDLDQGFGSSVRIGLAALAGNQVTEHEFRQILSVDGVDFYTSRVADSVSINPETLRETEKHLADAVSLILPGLQLDVVAFTCTSASIVNGEERIFRRIHEVRPGVRCTTPITAALAAMNALGLKRVAMLTPYVAEINAMMRDYIEARDISIPVVGSFNNGNDHEVARIAMSSVCAAVKELVRDETVDGVFVSCGSLRLADAVADLERDIGLPVFSSNTAMAWHCLRLAGNQTKLTGFGRLYGR